MTFGTKKKKKTSRPEKQCLLLNQICHVQFGEKISSLAWLAAVSFSTSSVFHAAWETGHFSGTDLAITLFLSKSFFTLTAATQKILHTESALKRQAVLKHFYNPKPALFLDERRTVAVSRQHKQNVYLKKSWFSACFQLSAALPP